MNKNGYSIVFFIGYLLGATCIIALGFEWLIALNNSYRLFTKKHRITVFAKLAQDSLMRDIHTAPTQQELWLNQGPDELTWKTDDKEIISWKVANNELIRAQKKIQKKKQ